MSPALLTPYFVALRFIGVHEEAGDKHCAAILAMLQLVDRSVRDDETPWCSAFVNYIAWLFGLPRSASLSARSWLGVGVEISLQDARPGTDVVILKRTANAPGPSVRDAPGHVGFFSSLDTARGVVKVLGGNQGNQVCLDEFPVHRVLGVRRLV